MSFGMAVFNSFLEKKEFTVAAALSGAIWWWTRPRLQPLCCQTGFLPLLCNPSTSHPIYSSQRGFINNVVMRAPCACGIWEALSQILRVGIWEIRGERWQTQWALIQTMGGFLLHFPWIWSPSWLPHHMSQHFSPTPSFLCGIRVSHVTISPSSCFARGL